MFTVPGWNLSTSVATQVEQPKPKDPSKEGKKAKKRRQKQEDQVNAENVGEYWAKVVSGEGQQVVEQEEAKDEKTGDGAQEKRGKKRKRKSTKKVEEDGQKAGIDGGAKAEVDGDQKEVEAVVAAPVAQAPMQNDGESKRDQKKRKKDQKTGPKPDPTTSKTNELSVVPAAISLLPEPKGLTPLQKSMRQKLASARFRHLNETLYTKPSADSLSLFTDDPTMFEDYHRGFAQQVEVWPSNPVDQYVSAILERGKVRTKDPWKDKKRKEKKGKSDKDVAVDSTPASGDVKQLPRNYKGHCTIADLGCGTASLSYRLQSQLKSLNMTLHSFDLSKPTGPSAPLVTVADISSLPLPDGAVDVAVFCLALMGTNWLDFIDEAYRILRWRGELWVAEIKSRFGRVEKRKPGKPPINSVGSLKKADKKPKGKDKPEEEGPQNSDDETELAVHIDGADAKEGTDVSAFTSVMLKHGFMLDALPERQSDAIDLSNKMFVNLRFVKGAQPVRGKNVRKDEAKGGMRMGLKGKKFIATSDGDGGSDEKDAKTLKPCLYKIR